MGLEEIIENIDADTRAKVASILDGAGKDAQRIREEAQKRANDHIEAIKKKAQNDASRLIARELSRANIESRRIYQDAITSVIDGTLESLSKSLQEYTKSTDYPSLLNKLATLAAKELGSDCIIYVQKADISKIKKVTGSIAEAKEEFVGGLKALSSDKKMSVDFTLENIFENLKDEVAVRVLKTLAKG
jgi:V/A-type H+-transporting ATPase subunit E